MATPFKSGVHYQDNISRREARSLGPRDLVKKGRKKKRKQALDIFSALWSKASRQTIKISKKISKEI